jgi:NADH-quinone oxidoreductase subunit J
MASFIGVAGLFILLLADLLAMLQVMMYIGGMLVMILFMVLFSHDPGGSMMTGMMRLSLLEKLFSLGLAHQQHEGGGHQQHDTGHQGMDMQEMSMTTPIKRQAVAVAALIGSLLVGLLLLRPVWPVANVLPDQDSPARVGHLLMGKYMIAFEAAGMLILLGIFGAVLLAAPGAYPDPTGRSDLRAAVSENPAPGIEEPLEPEYHVEPLTRGREDRP